jgi:uncharacterized protein YdeI (BOF family)
VKELLLKSSLAVALCIAMAPRLHAQQPGQNTTPAAPHQNDAQPAQQPQQPQPSEAPMPASGHSTTRPEKTFSGQIVMEDGHLLLKDPVTKVSYKLSDPKKARQFEGQQVKVTGKLDPNSSTIEVSQIEPAR